MSNHQEHTDYLRMNSIMCPAETVEKTTTFYPISVVLHIGIILPCALLLHLCITTY